MSKLSGIAIKAIKFGLIGFLGLFIDFSVTWALKEKLNVNKYLSNSCGFLVAATNNFLWNKYWTFQSNRDWMPEMFRFYTIALVGLLLNNLLLLLFHEKMRFNFYIGKASATICVFAWNFLANFYFNF